jgi:hypothetical protein
METNHSIGKDMKTNLLHKSCFIICALMLASFSVTRAQETSSTYIGPVGGNWSDPNNWSPAIVPNNSGSQTFDVTVGSEYPGVILDLDVALNSLTMVNDFSVIQSTDHSLTSASSSIAVNFADELQGGGFVVFNAVHTSIVGNLGNLADFSGTTLNSGNYVAGAEFPYADPGITSTIQFNGADVHTNNGDIQLAGVGSRFVDENGNDALRHFDHNLVNGVLLLDTGRSFTTSGSMVNEGLLWVEAQFGGAYGNGTLTISGDYTGIGYPLDPGTFGLALLNASGPIGDAKMIIKGALTNYDAVHKTLNKTRFQWEAANSRTAVTQVMGGSKPLDIVTSDASLNLFGPNTGFRDKAGKDALRNIAVSARWSMGDRDFTTVGSFTSTSRLSIYGNSHFNVNGHLTISGGQLQVFALTGYALNGDDGFPTDPPYKKTYVTVSGNLNLTPGIRSRYGIFDNATLPSVTIGGTAVLDGDLVPYLLDGANVSSSDSFTLLTASKITGQFSNVKSGQRVNAVSFPDELVVGTFKVNYSGRSLVLSDFHASHPH